MRYLLLVIFLFFSACSTKINPAEYHKISAPRSKYLPSPNELTSKTKVLILNVISKDDYARRYRLHNDLKGLIESLISNTSAITIHRNKKTTLKEEIIYAQESELTNSNINSANYIINAEITSTSYSHEYHKAIRWRDKKGKIHYQPPYYTYRGCVGGVIEIIKIPENYIAKTFYFSGCAYASSRYYRNYREILLKKALTDAIERLKTKFKEFFAKKGYVIEIRKKDDETIIKTTIGSNDGIKQGDIVNIYTIKEYINPLTNKPSKEIVLIGSGEVSNVINQNTSWIIVDKTKEPIKIGDFVKPKFDVGFFERIFE